MQGSGTGPSERYGYALQESHDECAQDILASVSAPSTEYLLDFRSFSQPLSTSFLSSAIATVWPCTYVSLLKSFVRLILEFTIYAKLYHWYWFVCDTLTVETSTETRTQCIFCFGNEDLSAADRLMTFASRGDLKKHFHRKQCRHYPDGQPTVCSHPQCDTTWTAKCICRVMPKWSTRTPLDLCCRRLDVCVQVL